MGRSGAQWRGRALNGAEHVAHDVSSEVMQASKSLQKCDRDGNRESRGSVRMVVPEYAGVYASYGREGSKWLGTEDKPVGRVESSALDRARCRYPRTDLSPPELSAMSQCRPNARGMRVLTVQQSKKVLDSLLQWVREGPLYHVTAEYQCDWTFVSTVGERLFVPGMNTVFRGKVMTEDGLPFLRLTECVQYPPLWRKGHHAHSAVKKLDALRRVPGSPVDLADWTLFWGDDVRWNRAVANSQCTQEPDKSTLSDFRSALPSSRPFSAAPSPYLSACVSSQSRPEVRGTPPCARCNRGSLP